MESFIRTVLNLLVIGLMVASIVVLIFAFAAPLKLLQKTKERALTVKETARPAPSLPVGTTTDEFAGIRVPEPGDKLLFPDIAVPKSAAPSAFGTITKDRIFEIKGVEGKYNPSTIIIYHNDNVIIDFTAVDRDYDMGFPEIRWTSPVVRQGQTLRLVFQASVTPGKYWLICRSTCAPGAITKIKGTLIVVPESKMPQETTQ